MDALLALFVMSATGFLITLFMMPLWMRKAHQIGLMWNDMNKHKSSLVAGSGGVIVTAAFIVSGLLFVAYRVFYLHTQTYVVEIVSMLLTLTLLAGIGFIDDLFGWQHGGLSRRTRIALVLVAALPLMAINAGRSTFEIPFWGAVDAGLLYPLFFIPLGIVGASTTFNFLAGFNGLEAGLGALMLGALSTVAYMTGNSWLAVLGLTMTACLLCFLIFNFCPARVFPGDCLTYPVGGMIAIMAILGNFERFALFIFLPVMIEFFLKTRGLYVKQSFGVPAPDGTLSLRYPKIYSLNHLAIFLMTAMNVRATEKRVVYSIWMLEIVIIIVGLVLFKPW